MSDLLKELRERTRELHKLLEEEPFMSRLARGEVEQRELVDYETCLAVIHGVLENSLAKHEDPVISAFWQEEFRRLPALIYDLEALREGDMTLDLSLVGGSLAIADRILNEAVQKPHALIGRLYVLMGSMKGGRLLAPIIAKQLNRPVGEVASYFQGPEDAGGVWTRFITALEGLDESALARQDLMIGAENLFRDIQGLAVSMKESGERGYHVAGLNPEAGNHAIVQDPLLIACAIRGGHSVCKEIKYVEERYGQRGFLFTLSDGAWILDLLEKGSSSLPKQMQWLARLLSIRGIPSWCLERHLFHLGKEVEAMGREKDKELLETLAVQLDFVKEYRLEQFEEEEQDRWVRDVCEELNLESDEVPRLMVSSMADEMRNWSGSLEILREHFAQSQLIRSDAYARVMISLESWLGLGIE